MLILTLMFVGTCTGRGHVQWRRSRQSANGSSIEEIMNELDAGYCNPCIVWLSGLLCNEYFACRSRIPRQIQQSTDCQLFGSTFGGQGGTAFIELPDNSGGVVRRILVRSGSRIDAIQVTYRLSNGQDFIGPHHGGSGGSEHTVDIDVDGGERIIGVFGRSGSRVNMLGFVTNRGRIIGPYGECGGEPFIVNSCLFRGIFGRKGSEVNSIGFVCSNP